MPIKANSVFIFVGAIVASITLSLQAQSLTYPGCSPVTAADFTKVPLVTRASHEINEPIQMQIASDGRVFWVERRGLVRVWNPNSNQATNLLDLSADLLTEENGGLEQGVSGIALDPNFNNNRWVYVYWTMKSQSVFRVSRYTLSGDALILEQPIIQIPYTNLGCCHTGGSMVFDFSGNLYIAVGNTTDNKNGLSSKDPTVALNYVNEASPHGDDQRGSANTNSLLGKILRIKPLPIVSGTVSETGPNSTYEIPEGNLFPVATSDRVRTRPEIYTMGHRNPYSITLDPYRNWLTWGDIGPDEFTKDDTVLTEEHGLTAKPGNMGWPYFVGKNQRFRLNKDPLNLTNTSINNTGLTQLPPAQPAIHPYGHAAAVTGPIYQYDGSLTSKTRLPPHFHKKWLFSDFNDGYIEVASPNEAGSALTAVSRVWPVRTLVRPLDLELGPDGTLYVMEYAGYFSPAIDTRIARLDYKGTCEDKSITPEFVGIKKSRAGKHLIIGGVMLGLSGNARVNLPKGTKGVRLYDLRGQRVFERLGLGGNEGWLALPASLDRGIYQTEFVPTGI